MSEITEIGSIVNRGNTEWIVYCPSQMSKPGSGKKNKTFKNACFSAIIPQGYINVSRKEKEERNIDRAWQEEFRRT